MDDQKIRQIVRDELTRNNNGARFGVNNIPFHTHNGIDSPSIFSPTITYTGYIPSDGLVNQTPFVFLPTGWTVELQFPGTTDIYKVTHNLGTSFYSVVVNQVGPGGSTVVNQVVAYDNYFEVAWFNGGTFYQKDFFFTLTQVNNKRNALPTYTLSGAI